MSESPLLVVDLEATCWGNYDRLHVEAQSRQTGAIPAMLRYPHLNLKRLWRRSTGQKRKNGLAHALAFHELGFEGHHHRGVDDARNMVRLLPFMDWSLEPVLFTPPQRWPGAPFVDAPQETEQNHGNTARSLLAGLLDWGKEP